MAEPGGKTSRIHVPVLTRVEGEGALELEIANGVISCLQLRIYEPPRFFEKFLEGRGYAELVDIVARICGICPVAYQMSAVQAIEQAFAAQPSPWVQAMRRLLYCGEWLESHALHIHMLALPDFLGFDNAIAMAAVYPDEVRRGLQLQALGNRIIAFLGGRSVHPVGVRPGGFYHAPSATDAAQLAADCAAALPQAEALLRWVATLPMPDDEQDFTSVCLRHADEYPMNGGRIVSSTGLDIVIEDYAAHFAESHVPHSTALHSHLHGQPYLVGPLARLNLNLDRLPERTAELLQQTGVRFPSRNMFHSLLARAVEIHVVLSDAVRLLQGYAVPAAPAVEVQPQAATGYGCTEAPRGILWHRYAFDAAGDIRAATIVPPTSQNQARIEQDLHAALLAYGLERPDEALRARCEQVIRNYDPCISCATHFLRLKVRRT